MCESVYRNNRGRIISESDGLYRGLLQVYLDIQVSVMHDLVYLQGYLLLYLKQIIKHFKYKIGKDRKKSMLIFYNTKEFFAKYSPEKVTKFDYTF